MIKPRDTQDVHKQFADYFNNKKLAPYLYLLSKQFAEGHICIHLNEIDEQLLDSEGYTNRISPEELVNEKLVSDGIEWQPLIVWKDRLYLQRYFKYEESVYNNIKELLLRNQAKSNLDLGKIKTEFSNFFPIDDLGKPDWQLVAAISTLLNQFQIITGGPGTGKTTTVAKILALLYQIQPEIKVVLAAPTGKAATRMTESLKAASNRKDLGLSKEQIDFFGSLEPATIHRLLGFNPQGLRFKHNAENPIDADVIIIDESSMIDMSLFAKLLDAVPLTSKIILLGDKNQLASVEAGSVFGDLCSTQEKSNQFSGTTVQIINNLLPKGKTLLGNENIQEKEDILTNHITELQHSYRFKEGGEIATLSRSIIQNNSDKVLAFASSKNKAVHIFHEQKEEEWKSFAQNYFNYIEDCWSFDPNNEKEKENAVRSTLSKLNQQRILCVVKEGPFGVETMNQKVASFLKEKGKIEPRLGFYHNQPIIVTENDYNLGLYNGDIGIIRENKEGKLMAWFETSEGTIKSVLPAFLPTTKTVFAMTIHKSQGSEFDNVLIQLPENEDNPLLTRELLYTAVTRAKKKVFIFGREQVLQNCCENQVKRGSGIVERFKD